MVCPQENTNIAMMKKKNSFLLKILRKKTYIFNMKCCTNADTYHLTQQPKRLFRLFER